MGDPPVASMKARPGLRRLLPGLLLFAFPGLLPAQTDSATEAGQRFFEEKVRPLLAEHCYSCHSSEARRLRGGLRLDSRAGWERGGDHGPALVPGDPEASLLIRAVRYVEEDLEMPPQGRLPDEALEILTSWVRMGAPDPREEEEAAAVAEAASLDWEAARRHWAFQAIADPEPPEVADEAWIRAPLDRFILAGLEARGLRPAPEADRRTWLRRVSFDLTGLPPTPEEIETFLADDSEDAYARVVDRLLSGPAFGERMARHWLDLARYADSNGLDENLALGNAWRYRDWVVRAFQEDLPYDEFVTLQLAGDLLPPAAAEQEQIERWTATGFLVLGPKMLAEQDKEKLVMDIVDEQIDVTSRAFLGLTVGCARCHDHKFDPVPTTDYYALAGVFRSTSTMQDLGFVSKWREREVPTAAERERMAAWKAEEERLSGDLAAARAAAEAALGGRWRSEVDRWLLAGTAAARSALFLEAEAASRTNLNADSRQWGGDGVTVLHTREPGTQFAEWDLSRKRPGRFRLWVRYASAERRGMRLLLDGQEIATEVLAEPTGDFKPAGQRWREVADLDLRPGRNVLRLEREGAVPHLDQLLLIPLDGPEAVPEWPRVSPWAEGLPEPVLRRWAAFLDRMEREDDPRFRVWFAWVRAGEGAGSLAAATAALRERVEAGETGIPARLRALLEGLPPESLREAASRLAAVLRGVERAWSAGAEEKEPAEPESPEDASLLALFHGPRSPFELPGDQELELLPEAEAGRLRELETALEAHRKEKPPPFPSVLCVEEAAEIRDLPVHIRGSHLRLAEEPVPRGFLTLLDHLVPGRLVEDDTSGRLALARWITHPENPLTSRVMVNRIWTWLFGQGIVRTPSNFGTRGEAPTHPELLDHLARRFQREGWSVKRLVRALVLSSAYRMGTDWNEEAGRLDPENRLLWRMNRKRLEAEPLRDALLAVSGLLDRTVGGTLLKTPNRAYVTNDQSRDQASYGSYRRALYLPVIRNAIYGMFATFDYNDPSLPLAQRPATNVAHQGLFFLNSPLVIEAAGAFAASLLERPGLTARERIGEAWVRALGRPPGAEELELSLAFLEEGDGLAAADPVASGGEEARRERWTRFCQSLFTLSEFLYLD